MEQLHDFCGFLSWRKTRFIYLPFPIYISNLSSNMKFLYIYRPQSKIHVSHHIRCEGWIRKEIFLNVMETFAIIELDWEEGYSMCFQRKNTSPWIIFKDHSPPEQHLSSIFNTTGDSMAPQSVTHFEVRDITQGLSGKFPFSCFLQLEDH